MCSTAVLFDLDGTLIDTAPDFANALNQLLAEEQRPPLEFTAIRSIASNGSRPMLQLAFDLTPEDAEFESLIEVQSYNQILYTASDFQNTPPD